MIIVKKDYLSYFKIPIHQRWFGRNKTWRGVLVMPLATWLGVIITEMIFPLFAPHSLFLCGVILGLAYIAAELPNSFIKRRLGIKEGKLPERKRWLFGLMDQADSAIGCLIVYRFLLGTSWTILLLTLIIGTLIHFLLNLILYFAGIRENAF